MKKIINGLLYNTESAKEIGYHSENFPGDFKYVCETLYKKRTGEYFLYCSGGAMSRYSTIVSGSALGTEVIKPLDYAEAKEFAEKFLDADTYQQEFGEVTEGSTTALHITLDSSIYAKIKRAAQENKTTIREVIEERFK